MYAHILLTLLTFLPCQFCKKKNKQTKQKNEFIMYGFSLVWLLVLILFRAILEQSLKKQNGEQNLGWNV